MRQPRFGENAFEHRFGNPSHAESAQHFVHSCEGFIRRTQRCPFGQHYERRLVELDEQARGLQGESAKRDGELKQAKRRTRALQQKTSNCTQFRKGPLCVSDLHLIAGVVCTEKIGNKVICRLAIPCLEFTQLLE